MIVCNTPEQIAAFRLLSIRGRLKLELKGLRFRGRSTFSIVKAKFGFKGNNAKVLEQFEAMLKERGIVRP